ncbi:hypothetical protein Q7P37_001686 [Cladosporium fusiforme]
MFPKPLYSLAATLLAAQAVHGHYIFSQLVVNDELVGGDYDYIRKNSNDYQPSFTADVINSEDLRCNTGALSSSAQTYDAKPGDKIGAKLWYNENIEHPGPGMIYMSKAPGSVSEYMGDGDWFKVWESGPEGPANVDASWGTYQKDRMEFTIPDGIPDGEYLVRFEHVGIHENHAATGSQFYMECAQIAITGGGSGEPGPMVQIPGLYSADDQAFTYSIWGQDDGSGYEMPGPAVWSGGGSSGGSSSSAGSSSSSEGSSSTETEAPATGSEAASSGSEAPASSGSAEAPSSGSDAPSTEAPSTEAPSSGSEVSTDAEAPADSSNMGAQQGGNQWEQAGQQGGEATAPASNEGQQGGWGGNWAPQNNQGGWGKRDDCAVEYVGGATSRARRAVKA